MHNLCLCLLYICNALVVCRCALSAPLCACQTLSTGSSCCEENTSDIDKNRLFFFLVNPWPLLLRVTQAARRVVLAPLFALQLCTASLCTAPPRRRPAERNLSRILALEPVSFCGKKEAQAQGSEFEDQGVLDPDPGDPGGAGSRI